MIEKLHRVPFNHNRLEDHDEAYRKYIGRIQASRDRMMQLMDIQEATQKRHPLLEAWQTRVLRHQPYRQPEIDAKAATVVENIDTLDRLLEANGEYRDLITLAIHVVETGEDFSGPEGR